ncbi:MAG TPA: hypothetical protein PLJ78_07860 [Anaerolineae bacterium]|nr:hypothetical protein [Anaerolineae bacterium]HQK13840.1 hypothetical protein [Anaerolineae bacterium]
MRGKNLPQAVTKLVQQLQARVQPLFADVTSLEVSTYGVDAPQLASVAASKDVTTLAAAADAPVQRRGYTRVTFHCDLHGCTEVGREEIIEAPVRPIHNVTVEQALVGRETLFVAIRETFSGLI